MTRRFLGPLLFGLIAASLFVAPVSASAESCDGKRATQAFGDGDDSIVGTPGNDVIISGDGNDSVDALAGDDRVCAGGGNDAVIGGVGDDRLFGEAGDDGLAGAEGDDLVAGGPGDDGADGESAASAPASDQSGLPFSGPDLPTLLVLVLALAGTWLLVSAALRVRRRRLARNTA